jgi:hypothetical protein
MLIVLDSNTSPILLGTIQRIVKHWSFGRRADSRFEQRSERTTRSLKDL